MNVTLGYLSLEESKDLYCMKCLLSLCMCDIVVQIDNSTFAHALGLQKYQKFIDRHLF